MNQSRQRQLQRRATEVLTRDAPWLDPLGRRVCTALLVRTAQRWRLFLHPGSPSDVADAYFIGPAGVCSLLIRDRLPDEATARAVARHAEERFAGVRGPGGQVLASSALRHLVVLPGGGKRVTSPSPLYRVVPEQDLDALFRREAAVLTRDQAQSIAAQAAHRLTGYRRVEVEPVERAAEAPGLLDEADLTADQLAAAQQRPFESWMAFLHPQQQAVVARNYGGPARISGPAGTGKTVVALHRLLHLARRSTGPLLFTTFVRTLPAVHQGTFHRMAPEFADRVRFVNLHAWARDFLAERGRPVTQWRAQVATAFNLAWLSHRAALADLEPAPAYWQAEVDRVIKGRGLTTVDEYLRVTRRGRGLALNPAQRTAVWGLYEAYERHLAEKDLSDYNDLVAIARAELAARPLEVPYAAVIVDEVQDITLTGLRLLRQLAGDGPNRLLLVGDGQQQVYPGGWRLSEAGIPVQGRGAVLRVNYRNRAAVLDFARRFDATNQVDDLDGAAGVALRDAETANPGGRTEPWTGTDSELPDALTGAIAALPVPRGRTALITFNHRDLERCAAILREAGVPVAHLDQYTGEPEDTVKIGTVHRAKGLDFQAVIAVAFTRSGKPNDPAEQELRARRHLVAATRARDYLWWGVVTPPADQAP
ncbi:AAA family ATPase [Actinokineospora auranticolor]|uniref:DNA 3'-5' helicase n=1 Tax=Actinokineospora auranticolor TaxID=155976 RepID=A0A2S6GF45_9PSEU|nr:UvrD-helicase domain-containing protein [Actinokineospora auranticolor]PPK63736.1 UvrD-like helicase family protein [Actinokineospora auranticolor]